LEKKTSKKLEHHHYSYRVLRKPKATSTNRALIFYVCKMLSTMDDDDDVRPFGHLPSPFDVPSCAELLFPYGNHRKVKSVCIKGRDSCSGRTCIASTRACVHTAHSTARSGGWGGWECNLSPNGVTESIIREEKLIREEKPLFRSTAASLSK
jgi:hypothetical protein